MDTLFSSVNCDYEHCNDDWFTDSRQHNTGKQQMWMGLSKDWVHLISLDVSVLTEETFLMDELPPSEPP